MSAITINPGMYELDVTVENPKPDARSKTWFSSKSFNPGLYKVSEDRVEKVGSDGCIMRTEDMRFLCLAWNLKPAPEDLQTVIMKNGSSRFDADDYLYDVLELLIKRGVLTLGGVDKILGEVSAALDAEAASKKEEASGD